MKADWVRGLPKAELHIHIEGTIEPDHAFALAARNGVELPWGSPAELAAAYRFDDLQSFLDVYYEVAAVLLTPQDFTDIVTAYLDRAREQGVRHVELFFDPQAHTSRGVSLETVIEGLWMAVGQSEATHGMTSGLILCFLRDLGPEAALETLTAAEPWRSRLLGVGLDSAEVGHPPADFEQVYRYAAQLGLRLVAHAGEEGPPEYIVQALDVLQVERIDHGIRAIEDDALVERLQSGRVPLTVCPLSNVRLRAVEDLAHHPLPRMLDAGLLVSVNSDDPAYFGGYVADNLAALLDADLIDLDQLRTLAENSFTSAFLDEGRRDRHLDDIRLHVDLLDV